MTLGAAFVAIQCSFGNSQNGVSTNKQACSHYNVFEFWHREVSYVSYNLRFSPLRPFSRVFFASQEYGCGFSYGLIMPKLTKRNISSEKGMF